VESTLQWQAELWFHSIDNSLAARKSPEWGASGDDEARNTVWGGTLEAQGKGF